MIVLYDGPVGSSDHRAIGLFRSLDAKEPYPLSSFAQVVYTVEVTAGCLGVVPLESSVSGLAMPVFDLLYFDTERVRICDEAILSETLAAFAATPHPQPKLVVSHPSILSLCSGYIEELGAETRGMRATSEACELVRDHADPTIVAIAPPAVGFGARLEVLDTDVSDVPEIRTRYGLLGREDPPASGDDRTLLGIEVAQDRPGALHSILGPFASRGINLTSLTSRPLPGAGDPHYFITACEGHVRDTALDETIGAVRGEGHRVRVLGCYPAWQIADQLATPYGAESRETANGAEEHGRPPPLGRAFGW